MPGHRIGAHTNFGARGQMPGFPHPPSQGTVWPHVPTLLLLLGWWACGCWALRAPSPRTAVFCVHERTTPLYGRCFSCCKLIVLLPFTPSTFLFLPPHLNLLFTASAPTPSENGVCRCLLPLPMATVNLISFNVRGLHAPRKRHNLYRELGRLRGDIVFLQETHLTHTTNVKLFSHQYPMWYYSLSDIHKAKGVAIGLRRDT